MSRPLMPSSNLNVGHNTHAEANTGLAPGRRPIDRHESGSWFESLARAWGNSLDGQASRLTSLANELNTGGDQPSTMTMLTAESQRMQFLSTSAHTSTSSVGSALETLGRKQ